MTEIIQTEAIQVIPVVLTRTQHQFFQAFAERAVRSSFDSVDDASVVDAFVSQIDFKELGKRFGEAMLTRVTYSDIKAVDKFMQSEQFINVMEALSHAVDNVALTQNDAENISLAASFILDTVSPVLAPVEYTEALAATEKPLSPLEQLLFGAKG